MKKMIAMLLALIVVLGCLAGCAAEKGLPTEEVKSTAEQEAKATEQTGAQESDEPTMEILKTTLYGSSESLESGSRDGYMKELFAKYGVEVEVWAYSEDKTNAIIASGDLPDVMYVKKDMLSTMIDAGMVLNLDDYMDQLPNLSKLEGMDSAMDYSRTYCSNGTGKLYALPMSVGPTVSNGQSDRNQLMLNWDYYYELGCPEFNDLYELIDVFKQMKENHPTDTQGNPTYAAVTYYDPSSLNFLNGYGSFFGYLGGYYDKLMALNSKENKLEYVLEEDGLLYNGVKWLNALYQEGLLDPESISIDRSSLLSRTWDTPDVGTYFSVLAEVSGSNDYFKPVYFPGEVSWFNGFNAFGVGNAVIVVNANSKNIEGALRLVNMFADPDAYLEWLSMPEGEAWYVKEGTNEAYLTDKFIEFLTDSGGMEFVMSTGEKRVLFNQLPIASQASSTSYVDADGNARTPFIWMWDEALLITNNQPRQAQWREHYGYDTWFDLMRDKDALVTSCKYFQADMFMELLSDEEKLTLSTILDQIVPLSWKMIYAESDAAFEGYWAELTQTAEGLGARNLYEAILAKYDAGAEIKAGLLSN